MISAFWLLALGSVEFFFVDAALPLAPRLLFFAGVVAAAFFDVFLPLSLALDAATAADASSLQMILTNLRSALVSFSMAWMVASAF